MMWDIVFTKEAENDFERFDNSQRILIRKAIKKVSRNPLPLSEGGYGKPLGKRAGSNLSGFLKITILKAGIRVVYKLERIDEHMVIIVIAMRSDEEVYLLAERRR